MAQQNTGKSEYAESSKVIRLKYLTLIFSFLIISFTVHTRAAERPNCESEAKFTLNYEHNSNLYMTSSDPEIDSAYKYNFKFDHDCTMTSGATIKFDVEREEKDFFRNTEENFENFDLGVEYTHPWRDESWFRLSFDREVDETSDAAYVEMEGDTNEYEARMGMTFSPKTSGEIYFGRKHSSYEIYNSSDADEDNFGAKYTYDLGGFSYVEVAFEKTNTDYPNSHLYDTETFLETSEYRTDEKSTFSVTVAKTISLYPLKYLYITAESSDNDSTSNTYYVWYDPLTYDELYFFRKGYDNYSNFNWSIYYIQDMSDRTSLSLYYLNDRTDYDNFLITYDDFFIMPSVPVTISMDIYYAALSYKLRENTTLELSGTRTKNSSNYSLMSYKQNLYDLSISYEF